MRLSVLFALAVGTAAMAQTSSVSYVDTYTAGLGYPARMAAGGGGIYVTDPPSKQVLEYDGSGALLNTYPIPEGPVGIAVVSGTRIFVSREDGAIGLYDATFTELATVDPLAATMVAPNGLAYDAGANELYAVDSGSHSVLVFEELVADTWTLARSWGTMGAGLGMFMAPQAIAFDAFNSHVVVADTGNYRVQVFDTAGVMLFKFGYRILFDVASELSWFARSEGVAVDSCGNIYVTDALMGTVRVFDENGVDLTGSHAPLVSYGAGAGQLRVPCDLMIDDTDRMFVANTNNASIEVLDVSCTPAALASTEVLATRKGKNARATRNIVKTFQGVSYMELPDNPYDIVDAMNAGVYMPNLDVNGDMRVNLIDLEFTVQHFGGATVEDFLNTPNVASHPTLDPPHILDINNRCGRCHAFDGAPNGMLTAAGQENLCLSCHSAGKMAGSDSIPGMDTGAIHPMDVVASPVAGSDVEDHLDAGKVRCGSCHEPHETMGESTYVRAPGEAINLCAKCHEGIFAEWSIAGHADEHGEAFVHYDWTLPNRASCRHCHSGNGYIDFANGLPDAQQNGAVRVIDCLVCHATHGTYQDEELLRIFDDVTLPGNQVITNKDISATCMTCHNGRRIPTDGGTPHYLLGGVMLEGINGFEFKACVGGTQAGEACFFNEDCDSNVCDGPYTYLQNTNHRDSLTCATCHMAPSPTAGNPGAGKVGGHTYNLKVHDPADPDFGFENVVNACQACHTTLTTLNRNTGNDYDGNGTADGVQVETLALLGMLLDDLHTAGAVDLPSYPYWNYAGVDPLILDLVKYCVWNYEFVENSGDLGVKNTGYAVGLLQTSIIELRAAIGGDPIPPWSPKYVP